MSDNIKKIVEKADLVAKNSGINMDVPDSSNLGIGLPPARKIQELQEDDDPKCKVCKESLKESAEVMKTLPGMSAEGVPFAYFGLRSD
ncbi:GL23694 [Drosophila persimilis]|uniref:GL23694 n=1 Tax=Drosophila persimilis TaxID=7234 RepID=B4G6A3_DROPE|nr:GL23694 [Drosophila persimilis]